MVCIVCVASKVANLTGVAASCPNVKKIVVIGEAIDETTRKLAEEANLELFTMKEIEVCLYVIGMSCV